MYLYIELYSFQRFYWDRYLNETLESPVESLLSGGEQRVPRLIFASTAAVSWIILSSIASERSYWSNEITWPDAVKKKDGRAIIDKQLKTVK